MKLQFLQRMFNSVPTWIYKVTGSAICVVLVLEFTGIDIATPINRLLNAHVDSMIDEVKNKNVRDNQL